MAKLKIKNKQGSGANKYFVISLIFFILFVGTLVFSISLMLKSEGEQEGGKEIGKGEIELKKGEISMAEAAEVEKLREALTKLEEEKEKLEREKSSLKKAFEEEQKSKPVFGVDKDSPFDHVKDSQIRVLKSKVEIGLKDVMWWHIADTNSMDPVLDIDSTALSVKPKSEDSLHIGDAAFYNSLIANQVIVHRIVKINSDDKGWYSKFKGDNLEEIDPEDVRFKQIEGILIGVIY